MIEADTIPLASGPCVRAELISRGVPEAPRKGIILVQQFNEIVSPLWLGTDLTFRQKQLAN